MKTYNFSTTVNYPETEADTPEFSGSAEYISACINKMLDTEPDATSFVITIVVNSEKQE